MLKFQNNKFIALDESDMKANGLLERFNLQEAIINSWVDFTIEIKVPDLIYVGHEVIPDDRVMGRIDILAYDPNDNIPVVIELKRDRDKYQLLQGISYAAMISNWSSEDYLVEARKHSENIEDLEELLSGVQINHEVRVLLIAEKFDPEVIISLDWLVQHYGVDLCAISLDIFKKDEELYFNFDQKYPLAELSEVYELRSRKSKKINPSFKEKSWQDVRAKLQYEWGGEFLDKCLKESSGDASRARFVHIRKNVDGLKAISFFFRMKYLNVYIFGKLDRPLDLFKKVFHNNIELNEWRNGYSIKLTSTSEYKDLCKWLNFDK